MSDVGGDGVKRRLTLGELNTARAMRREGRSIRRIAETMGLPKSTVGDALRGFGERGSVETCWCGETFIARSGKARSCSQAHSIKRWKLFGPIKRGNG